MKIFYSIESAKAVLKILSGDEYLVLDEAIKIAESLVDLKKKFFEGENEERRKIYRLLKEVNYSDDDPTTKITGVQMMVTCGEASTWLKIDFNNHITVTSCSWENLVEIYLKEIGVTLDEILEIYRAW